MLHTMAPCIATLHDFIADRSMVGVCHIDARPVIWYKEEEAGVYETLPISTGMKPLIIGHHQFLDAEALFYTRYAVLSMP